MRSTIALDVTSGTDLDNRGLPLCAGLPDVNAWACQPDAFDLVAEREARALAFMADELEAGNANIPTFEQRLTTSIIRGYRYNRVASYKAHERIERHYLARLAGQPSTYTCDKEICTRADRARRHLRHERRKLLLATLDAMQEQWVPFSTALILVDAKARTMYRAMMEGRLQKRVIGRKVYVAAADLRTYLRAKVAA